MTEEWRPVVGYEGQYEVSSLGRVRSLSSGKMLSTRVGSGGYTRVTLCHRAFHVHKLVAGAFLGPCPNRQEVRHLDGDRTNCGLSNLCYGTRSENHHDCYEYGGRHSGGKLYKEQVIEIRRLLSEGLSHREIARRFGVTHSAVGRINRNISYTYIK